MPESGTCTDIINLRYQDGSEGSPSNPAKFNNQDFNQLKQRHLTRGKLFVDTTFPPDTKSLGDVSNMTWWQEQQVEWRRPAEVVEIMLIQKKLSFMEDGASLFDFSQGNIGNCWFLAAIASLTFQKDLMVQVVPLNQSFEDYAGIFHFRFWRFGKWMDVVIDDYLPMHNNQLLSVKSKTGNEFWVPLLEKAYAKVCGSYADMNAGLPSEAFKDFSGGVHMTYRLKDVHNASHDAELWTSLSRATACKSMICCGTSPNGERGGNTVSYTGLVAAHAYTVTAVTEINNRGSVVQLVQLFNPWGKQEWNGKWSDKSTMWDGVSAVDRAKCFERNNGEFWMELEDFCYYFNLFSICCDNPNFMDGDLSCQWKCMVYDGKWLAGRSAGGSNTNDTFWMNPQYRIKVDKINQNEKEDKNILLSLMQRPQQRHRNQSRFHAIAVSVYLLPEGTREGRVGSNFFKTNWPMMQRTMYREEREVIKQLSLQPGEYLIVPSTIRPNKTADFVLSIYTKTDAKICVVDGDADCMEEHNVTDMDTDKDKWAANKNKWTNDKEKWTADKDKKPIDLRDEKIHDMFKRYADQSGELNYRQLQKLLNNNFLNGTSEGFDLQTCRSMIAIMDTDHRRQMTFTEFSNLWNKIEEFKKVFHASDLTRNGILSNYEVQMAINSAGINLDKTLVNLMLFRYAEVTAVSLDNFLTLMLRLEKISKVFNNKSSNGVATFTWSEMSDVVMYT
ncbi:calpain-1 catalytic subunit-like [Genypterus blacodes]|uniref:calpain-1 catalytic subunit-like n=1 Tax=Genypterus blacodes TaxID=154954 RepID=UPI003F7600A6